MHPHTQTHKHTLFKLHQQLVTRSVVLSAHKKSDVKWLKKPIQCVHLNYNRLQPTLVWRLIAYSCGWDTSGFIMWNECWLLTQNPQVTSIKKTKNKTVAHFRFIMHPDKSLCTSKQIIIIYIDLCDEHKVIASSSEEHVKSYTMFFHPVQSCVCKFPYDTDPLVLDSY